jgi:hypothetical protein
MNNNIEGDTDSVNPVSRDKLARLGDKLDEVERVNDDAAEVLYMQYAALAIARALASKPPKVKIKTTADLWAADALWHTLWEREKSIKPDNGRRMRTAADLAAVLMVTDRDRRVVFAAMEQYKANKQAKKQQRKEFWQQMRAAERNTVQAAGLSFPVVVQFGRRS